MVRSELEDQIRDYAIDEGILGKAVPHDNNLEFGYELNFPPNSPQPLKILILKIRERKALAMQLATQIAPQHIEGLKGLGANGVLLFFEALKKVLCSKISCIRLISRMVDTLFRTQFIPMA